MRPGESGLEEFKLRELQAKVDALCGQIKSGISREEFFEKEAELKKFCLSRYPDKKELYDLIYRSRFKRVWEQFRNEMIEFEEE